LKKENLQEEDPKPKIEKQEEKTKIAEDSFLADSNWVDPNGHIRIKPISFKM